MASPPPANFQTQSGIRQSLRRLELCDIAHRKLTTAFCYLMALPTLQELVFKRLILRSRSLSRLPTTPPRVTSLLFSHYFIPPEAVQELFAVRPSLVNFDHKLEGSFSGQPIVEHLPRPWRVPAVLADAAHNSVEHRYHEHASSSYV
jgi:hypothetical protein